MGSVNSNDAINKIINVFKVVSLEKSRAMFYLLQWNEFPVLAKQLWTYILIGNWPFLINFVLPWKFQLWSWNFHWKLSWKQKLEICKRCLFKTFGPKTFWYIIVTNHTSQLLLLRATYEIMNIIPYQRM